MNVMVDLETLSTRPNAAILSIGAVTFNPHTGWIGSPFYRVIDQNTTDVAHFDVELSTVEWWMMQSLEAREAVFGPGVGRSGASVAIYDFRNYYREVGATKIWSHGAGFDVVILDGYNRHYFGKEFIPWSHSDVRDTRTVYDLADHYPDRTFGTYHHALHDAQNQAAAVIECYRKLNLNVEGLNDVGPGLKDEAAGHSRYAGGSAVTPAAAESRPAACVPTDDGHSLG